MRYRVPYKECTWIVGPIAIPRICAPELIHSFTMPRSKQRNKQLANARDNRINFNHGRCGTFGGISNHSPLKSIGTGKRQCRPKKVFDPGDTPKILRKVEKTTSKRSCQIPRTQDLLYMEKKYQSILELLHIKWASEKGCVTNAKAAEIAPLIILAATHRKLEPRNLN